MKKSIMGLAVAACAVLLLMRSEASPPQQTPTIVVDQFGYRPDMDKIAVLRDPEIGFDAGQAFRPGARIEVVDVKTGATVYSGAARPWKNGAVDESSGDRAYHFDFSAVRAPGVYVVRDAASGARSAEFEVAADVYRDVLRDAFRVFYYQRVGVAKERPFADEGWTDAASHVGPGQDKEARLYSAKNDPTTARDVSGGWYDAGDYNKYTSWTANYVVALLQSFEESPTAWGDDFGIPESGNGVSDLLDEVRWGLDWLTRMQNADGSVLSIVGLAHASPPSAAKDPSYYGPANTSATLATAAAFAYAARIFGPQDKAYGQSLAQRAERAWAWAAANPAVIFRNNDAEQGSQGLGAGQQEVDDQGRLAMRLHASAALFALTRADGYRRAFDREFAAAPLIAKSYASPFESKSQDALRLYAKTPGASPVVAQRIRKMFDDALSGGRDFLGAPRYDVDPYGAPVSVYTWGSNSVKARAGVMLIETGQAEGRARGAAFLHYLHGVNPLGKVYLSNMKRAGAENSVDQFYHSWFAHGSARWDSVSGSTHGPPPGFVAGGPNPSYRPDRCCPLSCGAPQNNALCALAPSPPLGQPPQKSYADFNDSWPLNSWEVTENSNGYQVDYLRLLAHFVADPPTQTGP